MLVKFQEEKKTEWKWKYTFVIWRKVWEQTPQCCCKFRHCWLNLKSCTARKQPLPFMKPNRYEQNRTEQPNARQTYKLLRMIMKTWQLWTSGKSVADAFNVSACLPLQQQNMPSTPTKFSLQIFSLQIAHDFHCFVAKYKKLKTFALACLNFHANKLLVVVLLAVIGYGIS